MQIGPHFYLMKLKREKVLSMIPHKTILIFALIVGMCVLAYAEEEKQKAQGLDMVSDTVATTFNKVNAL